MAKRDDGRVKDVPFDDDYWNAQWEKARERDKATGDAFRKRWLGWQKEQAGRAPYSGWLVLPCHLTDYGARPLAAGMPYWASPFIGVISPDPSGQPQAGAPNLLFARVFNLGAATAAPTRVEFHWADPSVGLGEADAHFIGAETVEIPPMSSAIVTCSTPWIPSYLNGGHECAFVSASNHVLDPLLLPFQPWADRHVGQRNLSVLPAVAQAFALWMPGSGAGRLGELRALALRTHVLKGMPGGRTPIARLETVAQWALHGLRQLPGEARQKTAPVPPVATRRVDAHSLLKGARLLEARRPHQRDDKRDTHPIVKDPDTLGDVVLRQDPQDADAARRFELEFAAIELSMDEVAILHLTFVCAGRVEGGYVVVLAHPAWFKSAAAARPGALANPGGSMSIPIPPGPQGLSGTRSVSDQQLRDLVVHFNPLARATLELAQQLAPLLPIESAERLGKELRVGGEFVDSAFLLQFAGGMLPIRDEKELVFKLAALLKLVKAHGEAHRPTLSGATARFLDQLGSVDPAARSPIPVLYGRGSLFRLADANTKGG